MPHQTPLFINCHFQHNITIWHFPSCLTSYRFLRLKSVSANTFGVFFLCFVKFLRKTVMSLTSLEIPVVALFPLQLTVITHVCRTVLFRQTHGSGAVFTMHMMSHQVVCICSGFLPLSSYSLMSFLFDIARFSHTWSFLAYHLLYFNTRSLLAKIRVSWHPPSPKCSPLSC